MERHTKLNQFITDEYQSLLSYAKQKWRDTESLEAEDILQDVLASLYEKADITVPLENLAGYIYTSIRNRIIDMIRKKRIQTLSLQVKQRKDEILQLEDFLPDNRYLPDREQEKKTDLQQLEKALETLSPSEKAVIIETEFHGVPFRILSEMWDMPVGTLLSRKSRALKKIKHYLEKNMEVYNET